MKDFFEWGYGMLTVDYQVRTALILSYCQGKRVLDIGACSHGMDPAMDKAGFLHVALCEIAKEVVGIDVNFDAVLQKNG